MPAILAARLIEAALNHGHGALHRLRADHPEDPVVYAHLHQQLFQVDVTTNELFQFQYRCFYGLRRREVPADYFPRFFTLLERYKHSVAVVQNPYTLLRMLTTELGVDEKRGQYLLSFGYATRLLNSLSPALPVYSANLAAVCGLAHIDKLPAEHGLNRLMAHYRRLVPATAWAAADPALDLVLWQFDQTFPGNTLLAAHKLTMLLYDTGKIYQRAEQQAREAHAAQLRLRDEAAETEEGA